ncbi:uncharacterized protein LOC110821325 [Carica papaya]|uniref:uncharacterized protein LOC110821325 n=1 Tax=Carica papaya TaxID=3649 RepID=UPI000B8CD2AA|nr:uncharacterized protein LOC110821325 [Carica papaya]
MEEGLNCAEEGLSGPMVVLDNTVEAPDCTMVVPSDAVGAPDHTMVVLDDGLKTIEGRCAGGVYNRIAPGTSILVNKCVAFAVEDVHQYASFSEMLEAEGLAKVLPGVETVEEGVQVYRKFYTEEKERSNGVIAICVSKLAAQPYIILASLLAGLSYAGIQSLLGVAHTAGTVFDALPPPRSTLLSSFTLPYKANVKGASLTHGAREFTKHVHRSSDKFWGIVSGNDLDKNKHAVAVIYYLIANCCWLNVHVVQPHGAVFEIRVADGYGARWSNNGTKFIGFVEPYVEDGHSRGWRH